MKRKNPPGLMWNFGYKDGILFSNSISLKKPTTIEFHEIEIEYKIRFSKEISENGYYPELNKFNDYFRGYLAALFSTISVHLFHNRNDVIKWSKKIYSSLILKDTFRILHFSLSNQGKFILHNYSKLYHDYYFFIMNLLEELKYFKRKGNLYQLTDEGFYLALKIPTNFSNFILKNLEDLRKIISPMINYLEHNHK